jgi:hypothetical protein
MTDQIAIECYGETRARRRAEFSAREFSRGRPATAGRRTMAEWRQSGDWRSRERDDRYSLDQGGTTPVMRA